MIGNKIMQQEGSQLDSLLAATRVDLSFEMVAKARTYLLPSIVSGNTDMFLGSNVQLLGTDSLPKQRSMIINRAVPLIRVERISKPWWKIWHHLV